MGSCRESGSSGGREVPESWDDGEFAILVMRDVKFASSRRRPAFFAFPHFIGGIGRKERTRKGIFPLKRYFALYDERYL